MTYEDQALVQEKIKLIDYQMIATTVFIMSTILSILLLYNQKLDILKKEPIFDAKESKAIHIFNSYIVLIIILFLQYLNYKSKDISEFELKNVAPINLDINASYLLIIASILSLYAAYISPEDETEAISLI